MSLQLAAQHLAAQGRGPDKNLVHMSPREVAGLQALAKAGGGSLSINPETGLPEAGFLENMLPMLIGVGLTAATGGAATPLMVGLGIGGLEAARTGNISKGLMAGLGAYGGAGLGAGLMGAGAETMAATTNAMGVPAATGPGSQAAMLAAQNQGFGQAGLEALGKSAATPLQFSNFVQTPMQSMTSGAMGLTEAPGRTAFMNAIGGDKEALRFGAAAAAPMLMSEPEPVKAPTSGPNPYQYRFDPGRTEEGYIDPVTGMRRYFNPTYTRLAAGGPVEAMSAANVSDMQNARGGVSDMGIDNSTGMQRMAQGGFSGLKALAKYGSNDNEENYAYDPVTKTYRKTSLKKSVAEAPQSLNALDAGGFGGDISMGGETLGGFGHGYGAGAGVGAIGFGQGLSGMGMTGVGDAVSNAGIATLGAMEAQAAADAAAQGYGGAGGGTGVGAGGDIGGGSGVGGAEGGYGGGDGGVGYARGGVSHLGDYSDGGRLLRGPGDGVSDSIPATIGRKQPARLADGEFVVPARIVSELGNGSTEAGARKLYAMMDRVQSARGKTTGKDKVAKNTRSDKYLPA
jgi:hypothetical protein